MAGPSCKRRTACELPAAPGGTTMLKCCSPSRSERSNMQTALQTPARCQMPSACATQDAATDGRASPVELTSYHAVIRSCF